MGRGGRSEGWREKKGERGRGTEMTKRDKDRQRKRERETDRQTDRQTRRQTNRQTDSNRPKIRLRESQKT